MSHPQHHSEHETLKHEVRQLLATYDRSILRNGVHVGDELKFDAELARVRALVEQEK